MTRTKLLPIIHEQCAIYFGTKAKKWTDNKCGKCPLHTACRKFNSTVGRDNAELENAREVFNQEATEILGGAS